MKHTCEWSSFVLSNKTKAPCSLDSSKNYQGLQPCGDGILATRPLPQIDDAHDEECEDDLDDVVDEDCLDGEVEPIVDHCLQEKSSKEFISN